MCITHHSGCRDAVGLLHVGAVGGGRFPVRLALLPAPLPQKWVGMIWLQKLCDVAMFLWVRACRLPLRLIGVSSVPSSWGLCMSAPVRATFRS